MADAELKAVISVEDRASATLKKTSNNLKELGQSSNKAESSVAKFGAGLSNSTGAVTRYTSSVRQLTTQLKTLNGVKAITLSVRDNATSRINSIKSSLNSLKKNHVVNVAVRGGGQVASKVGNLAQGALGSTALGMGVMAGVGFGLADGVKSAVDFEQQMKDVQAISGATSEELDILSATAKRMGATTAFSATESGKAMEYMAMAGWNTQQMTGGIAGIMNLAAASGEDLATTSDIVTDALTAFGMKAEESSHFADVLAMASSKSNTNVALMGETFKYVAPMAGSLGYSAEDAAVAIGLMANAGIKGSMAGTALNGVLTRMATLPKQTSEAMSALGVEMFTASGKAKPLGDMMRELRGKLRGLSDEQKTQYASMIAGQESAKGFLAIINASDSDFESLSQNIHNANGKAQEMANTRLDTVRGDVTLLKSAWEGLNIAVLDTQSNTSVVRGFLQGISDQLSIATDKINNGGDAFWAFSDALADIGSKHWIISSLIALAGAYKGIKMAGAFLDGLRSVKGGLSGNGSGGGNTAVMNVRANVVNLSGGATPSTSPADVPVPDARQKRPSRVKRVGRGIGGVGRRVLGGIGDFLGGVYNSTMAGGRGNILRRMGGGLRGAGAIGTVLGGVSLAGSYMDMRQAQANGNADGAKQAQDAMKSTIGGMAGGAIGGAIGSIIGPIGTMVGGMLGASIGESLATMDWANEFAYLGNSATQIFATIGEFFNSVCSGISSAVGSVVGYITSGFSSAYDSIVGTFSGIGDWFYSNVVQPIADAMASIPSPSQMVGGVTSFVSNAFGVGEHATGAVSFGGGLTTLNERGGEIFDLPNGTRIYPHHTTMDMLENQFGGFSGSNTSMIVTGNTFVVREDADIDRIADAIYRKFAMANNNYGGAY